MEKIELEVYSDVSNHAVIRPPGRRFPGLVIQGDSLASLCHDIREVALWVQVNSAENDEIRSVVQDIQEQLLDRLLHYQAVLQTNGLGLPYASAMSRLDLVTLDQAKDDGRDS